MRALHLVLTLLAALAAACAPEPNPRSVLIVVSDSLAAAHVGSYGAARDTTPHFDRFAQRGVRFERAYAQSSWTLPSVASVFTSLPQESHSLRSLEQRLDERWPTLAESFRARGYRTAAIVQTPVLGSRAGLGRGFDAYSVLDGSNSSCDAALERARREWSADGDAPLFLYVHLTPPHMPYQPPAPFRGRFSTPSESAVDGSIASARRIHKDGLAPDHEDVQRLCALYDENIAYADARVGAFLDDVQRTPRGARALALWTADHGEAFMQHGAQGHNANVFEEMVRVPMAWVALDGSFSGRVEGAVACLLDIAPTLVELCDLRPLPDARGVSLAPLLRSSDARLAPRDLVLSSRYYDAHPQRLHLALVRESLKLHWDVERDAWSAFDLAQDPSESRDVFVGRERELAEMRGTLRAVRAATTRAPTPSAPSSAGDTELEHREALRKLGYTED
ncbi:MAG: sulfatase [Planctomycetes bacterium]|nr:sulfatase [Planctomycetota bacterium]